MSEVASTAASPDAAAPPAAVEPAPAEMAATEVAVSKVFDLLEHIEQGYRFEREGAGFHVVSPEGRHGHGPTAEEAVANIDAQILPNRETGLREIHRRDGSIVALDRATEPVAETDSPAAPAGEIINPEATE